MAANEFGKTRRAMMMRGGDVAIVKHMGSAGNVGGFGAQRGPCHLMNMSARKRSEKSTSRFGASLLAWF